MCIGCGWTPSTRGEAPRGSQSAEAGPGLESCEKPSVAVLPFADMSDDPEQEHFTDRFTDHIITDLAKIGGFAVVARNSAFTGEAG
jgi:TolB-like protein